jgi:hypothetical protein
MVMNRFETEDPRESASTGESEVRELLRVAGRRPQPPREDSERIEAAARQAWEELVDRRRENQRGRFGGPADWCSPPWPPSGGRGPTAGPPRPSSRVSSG